MNDHHYPPVRVTWEDAADALIQVRHAVFVAEQGVPMAMEIDADDGDAVHLLVRDDAGNPIATGRLLSDGRIGRMAVLQPWRGRGIGSAILRELMRIAVERGQQMLFLHAQCDAQGFYHRHGFEPDGTMFVEAGIPHQTMQRPAT